MEDIKVKTIAITPQVHKEIMLLKYTLEVKTINEVIQYLIDYQKKQTEDN